MFRTFRFSILDIILVTCGFAIFFHGNVVPQDIGHPSSTHRIEGVGFPKRWAVYRLPARESLARMAQRNWHLIALNGLLCSVLTTAAMATGRRLRGWIQLTRAPGCNPARLILLPIGSLAILIGLPNSFVARDVGQFAVCVGILAIGILAIWLARRSWDQLNRWTTIVWCITTSLILLYAFFVVDPIGFPPSKRDYPGIGLFLIVLSAHVATGWLALRKPAISAARISAS